MTFEDIGNGHTSRLSTHAITNTDNSIKDTNNEIITIPNPLFRRKSVQVSDTSSLITKFTEPPINC
jgi:hypothetical protein